MTITGQAPVAQMQDYATEVRNYTHGSGQLECLFAGYRKCKNSAEVIESINYDPVSDIYNTPNSVFALMAQVILLFGMKCQIMLNIRIYNLKIAYDRLKR